jgi:hypothetical protein
MNSSGDRLPTASKGAANTINGPHEIFSQDEWLRQRVALLREEKKRKQVSVMTN